MFGDYTITQAATLLDTCDEIIEETVKRGGLPTSRKFLLFGPVLIKKSLIDDIAPEMRASHQRTGRTRADWNRRKQERQQYEQEIERKKEHIKTIQEESKIEQEEFYKQIFGLVNIQYVPIEYPTPDMADQDL